VPKSHAKRPQYRHPIDSSHRAQRADPRALAAHRQDSATILGKLDAGNRPLAVAIADRCALVDTRAAAGFLMRKISPMRSLTSVALTIAGVTFAALPANSLRAEVLVQGQAGAVRVEAHDATVAEILAALGERFALRYRGIPESGSVTATFEGPLRRVVGRVLERYNYVIEPRADGLEVVVLGAASSQAAPPPVYTSPSYPAKRVRRTD
jgi:hypothetical protein